MDGIGALSGTRTNRKNVFSKIEVPIGENTVITLVGLYDDNYANIPYGATAAEIAKYGPKYALNDDPRSQAYRGYNWDQYHTDFEYLGLRSNLGGGWAVDNKSYTNSYFQQGKTGADPNGTTPNLTSTGRVRYISNGQVVTLGNDVPGFVKHNDFRDFGNILQVTRETSIGQVRTGFWMMTRSHPTTATRPCSTRAQSPTMPPPRQCRRSTRATTIPSCVSYSPTWNGR